MTLGESSFPDLFMKKLKLRARKLMQKFKFAAYCFNYGDDDLVQDTVMVLLNSVRQDPASGQYMKVDGTIIHQGLAAFANGVMLNLLRDKIRKDKREKGDEKQVVLADLNITDEGQDGRLREAPDPGLLIDRRMELELLTQLLEEELGKIDHPLARILVKLVLEEGYMVDRAIKYLQEEYPEHKLARATAYRWVDRVREAVRTRWQSQEAA